MKNPLAWENYERILIEENTRISGYPLFGVKFLGRADKEFDRIISIGDIHGCCDSLTYHLEQLKPTKNDLIIFMGDYVDRGPQNPEVIDFLIEYRKFYTCIFLRGNHDSMMLNYYGFGGLYGRYWRQNGGDVTQEQYRKLKIPQLLDTPDNLFSERQQDAILKDYIPQKHIQFLLRTNAYIEMNHAFYSHAGFNCNSWSINHLKQTEENYTWTREAFLGKVNGPHKDILNKTVVHGHTINQPHYLPYWKKEYNQINLDSGCFASGNMSSLIVDAKKTKASWKFLVSNWKKRETELKKIDEYTQDF